MCVQCSAVNVTSMWAEKDSLLTLDSQARKLPKLRNGSKMVETRVFTTESLTFYPERYHAPFNGREGDAGGGGAEKKRERERRHRGRETERVFLMQTGTRV